MGLNNITRKYWTSEDLLELEQVEDVKKMFEIGYRVLKRMPQPVGQVCGPISTGGLGSVLKNLIAFNETIIFLQADGNNIFDQMPFEEPIKRMTLGIKPGEYATFLLTDFYLPLFESGLVKKFYFMKDWQSSKGAKWEHEQAIRLGIEIKYLN